MSAITSPLSTTAAARLLGVSRDTVVRHIAAGQLAAINVGTGERPVYRVSIGSIEDFKTRRLTAAAAGAGKQRRKPGRRRQWVK